MTLNGVGPQTRGLSPHQLMVSRFAGRTSRGHRDEPRQLSHSPTRKGQARVSLLKKIKAIRRLACSCFDFEPLLAGTVFESRIPQPAQPNWM
jgi:hypothetical protein